MPSWISVFQFLTFLSVTLSDAGYISISNLSLNFCISFFILFIHSTFLLCYFSSYRKFTPNLFCLFCIWLLVCSRSISTYLAEFSFVILERPFLFELLDPVSVSFISPFFREYLWINLFILYLQTCLQFCFFSVTNFKHFHLSIFLCFPFSFAFSLLSQFLYLSV